MIFFLEEFFFDILNKQDLKLIRLSFITYKMYRNDLDQYLEPFQDRIIRYRNDEGRQPGNPYWYALRQPGQPNDTFNQSYRKNANDEFYI